MNSEINIKHYLPETNFDLNLISDYFEKNMIDNSALNLNKIQTTSVQ
jgi:hypothetical protein